MKHQRIIFKNTFVLAASRLIERSGNIFLAFFVARSLGATGLGIYSAAIMWYAFMSVAAGMGSVNYLVREIAKDRAQTSRYLTHVATLVSALSLILMGLGWLLVPHFGYSAPLTAGMKLAILAILPGVLGNAQEAVFIAYQRVEFISYTSLLAAVANVSISVYLLRHGYGILSLLAAFVIVRYLVMACYCVFISLLVTPITSKFEPKFAIAVMREIKVFAGSSILGGLFARPEVILLSLVTSEAQIGFYTAALKIVALWDLIPQTYMVNVFPVLSRAYHAGDNDTRTMLHDSLRYLLAISLPLAVGIFAAAQPILDFVYGPGFRAAVVPLKLLAWDIPLISLFAVLWRVLSAQNKHHLVFRVQVITTLGRLGLGYALISSFAALGAAITTVLSLVAHNLLLAFHIRRAGTRLRVFRLTWRLVLAAVTMGFLTAWFKYHIKLELLVAVAGICYLGLLFVLKAFSPEELALLRKALRLGGPRDEAAGPA
jgi:O-antigen/teichoic acid export membrane protein